MEIVMQSGKRTEELQFTQWEHAIIGEAIDPRGVAAHDFVKKNSTCIHTFKYDAKKLEFEFDGSRYSAEEPECAVSNLGNTSVLLEATTLGFVEILLCCRALRESSQQGVSLIYVEPKSYFQPRRSQIVHRRLFELSDEVEEFTAVPGNALLLLRDRPLKSVVFVGFEGQRLYRFLEQTGLSSRNCEFIFGVPAYHPGWEMDAFANNFYALKGQDMAARTSYCGAQNPASAYQQISRIYRSCNVGERLSVTPIGTKPHGIGAALFLCEHSDVGVVYDNPKRKKDRTKELGTWHLFEVQFT